ncbi:MAG TPA: UBP-type zinc finger domain-containing protein [Candidatus Saccharimonadales bacterium]|nr:UBP-type zinc finger domain-containing protein [Candidatus Saccharimonadales bacterium]
MKQQKPSIHYYSKPGGRSPASVVLGLAVALLVGASGAYLIHSSSANGGGGPLIYVATNPAGVANACWDVQLSWDNSNWADYGTRCTDSSGQYVMDSQYTYYRITATTVPAGYGFKQWCLPSGTCTSNQTIYFASSAYANQHIYMSLSAPPAPPSGPRLSVSGSTGSSIGLVWSAGSSGSYGSISGYQIRRDNSYLTTAAAGSTGYTDTGLGCGQTHNYSVTLVTSGGATASSNTVTGATSACPSPAPSGGGTSTGTASKPVSPVSAASGGAAQQPKVVIAPAQPPSAPNGFAADVVSGKVIQLSWNAGLAGAGVQNYALDRSTDNVTWQPLATPLGTSYTDTTADFDTHYYFRVREVDTDGATSDYATTEVTTGRFTSTAGSIQSDDRLVTAAIPDGAFGQPVNCSITSVSDGPPSIPTRSLLAGPYSVLCVAADGSTVTGFAEPLRVTMKLGSLAKGHDSFAVQLFGDDGTGSDAHAAFDARHNTLSFKLDSSKSFAAYGTKRASLWPAVFKGLMLLLAFAGTVGVIVYLRRTRPGRPLPLAGHLSLPAAATDPSATAMFEQAVNKPNCTHLNMARQVQPQSTGCAECIAEHTHWKSLRICLSCGHVGCGEDSSGQHARKHYEQSGHPLIYEYGNPAGDAIGWCYIDQTYI